MPITMYVGELVSDRDGNYIGQLNAIRCGGTSNTISIIIQDGETYLVYDVSLIYPYTQETPLRFRAQQCKYNTHSSFLNDIEYASLLRSSPAMMRTPSQVRTSTSHARRTHDSPQITSCTSNNVSRSTDCVRSAESH